MRHLLSVWLLVGVALGALPSAAWAAAPPKGQVIARQSTLMGVTGSCVCDQRWYRVGLKRGQATVSLRLVGTQNRTIAPYALSASVMQGTEEVRGALLSCTLKQQRCGKTATLRLKVQRAGAYRIMVRGIGAEGITFTLRVRGSIYRLR